MLIAFYIFAALTLLSAIGVVLLRNPVYSALSLVATLFFVAGIFVIIGQEFLAAMQVLIYAGAIMVLFLFVIMLLNLKAETKEGFRFTLPQLLGGLLSVGFFAQLVMVFVGAKAQLGATGAYSAERIEAEGGLNIIGDLMFTRFVLPFEVISVLLMVAVVGAVLLAKKRKEPAEQEDA